MSNLKDFFPAISVTVNSVAPTTPGVGDVWLDPITNIEKRWDGVVWSTSVIKSNTTAQLHSKHTS